ncbi:glucosyl-3-phosphoglycerate synthase [bacterium]|nr:glucosyl-3-phosphoglycerate synthase [bacterium]
MGKNWLESNTFHHSKFADIGNLVKAKQEKSLIISLCLPTLNEEKTIAKEIVIMKSELMDRHKLLDEIIVIDSGSSDKTREIADHYGADVYLSDDILPNLEPYKGKGENLWKALFIAKGDIIVYLDTDIKNIHHRFAYALIGPLLLQEGIKYTKAFYDRPIAEGANGIRPTGGGRVTELVIRPLFALFFPELTQIVQPLSGEYAGYRSLFEKLLFPIGYGIETSMIIEIYKNWGLDVIAQVDLDRRVHRNQSTKSLGKMSFAILQRFLARISDYGMIQLKTELYDQMKQFVHLPQVYQQEIYAFQKQERPPMITIPEYREKFINR